MAVHAPYVSPYSKILIELTDKARSLPAEEIPRFRAEYLKRIDEISRKETQKEVGRYLRGILRTLYGVENEKQMKADVAKISVGGRVANIELTVKEKTWVASLLTNECKRLYGNLPLSML